MRNASVARLVALLSLAVSIESFGLQQRTRPRIFSFQQFASKEEFGDPLRAATGIRPSLHPVTINALADLLKTRAKNDESAPVRVSDTVQPLQVALTASRIAVEAIERRQATSNEDGMKLEAEEEQVIAGRVVGVAMRLESLELTLYEKAKATSWVSKYGEWGTFGVLAEETDTSAVDEQVKMDPLFAMNRAECLLALFLETVEGPELELKNATVPDGSVVDFLDEDRRSVLLGS